MLVTWIFEKTIIFQICDFMRDVMPKSVCRCLGPVQGNLAHKFHAWPKQFNSHINPLHAYWTDLSPIMKLARLFCCKHQNAILQDKWFSNNRNHQFQMRIDLMCFLVVLVLEPVHIIYHQFHYLHSHIISLHRSHHRHH